jgi:hypothetical protein
MKPDLVFAGNIRTGTTTIWNALKTHPDICCTSKKDGVKAVLGEDAPMYNYKIRAVSEEFPFYEKYEPDLYMNYFKDKHAKVFFDGANLPNILAGKRLVHIIKDIIERHNHLFNRVCCIYTLRDPWERLESSMFVFARMRVYHSELTQEFFTEEGEVNEEFIKNVIFHLADEYTLIKRTMSFIGPENILFLNLNKINTEKDKIIKFFNISDCDINFGHHNKNFFNLKDRYNILPNLKAISDTLKILRKNKDAAMDIARESTRKLEKIGIEYG